MMLMVRMTIMMIIMMMTVMIMMMMMIALRFVEQVEKSLRATVAIDI